MDFSLQIYEHFVNNALVKLAHKEIDGSLWQLTIFLFIISIVDSIFMVKLIEVKKWIFKSLDIFGGHFDLFMTILFHNFFHKTLSKNWPKRLTKFNTTQFLLLIFWSLNHEWSIPQTHNVPHWNFIYMISNFSNAYEALWPTL